MLVHLPHICGSLALASVGRNNQRHCVVWIQSKIAGGSPTASHFFLLRQEKVTKKKATPVRRCCAVPSISRKRAGLRNSHDPLRGHVLKQCSPNPTARSRLIEAAYRGREVKCGGAVLCALRARLFCLGEAGNARLTGVEVWLLGFDFHPLCVRRVAEAGQGISARTV